VASEYGGLQILNVANPASPTLLGTCDTPSYAHSVAVSGTLAYVTDINSGLHVIDVSNPAIPTLLGSYDTPEARSLAVVGTVAYVGGGNSLRIIEVTQNRFDAPRNVGRSLAMSFAMDPIRLARLTSTQVNNVAWELSANGGSNWQAATPGVWTVFTTGSDLRWRATLFPVPPSNSTPAPEVSRVDFEWLYDFPVIETITDIGPDQGGWIRARFARSASDFADQASLPIANYGVWRRVDSAALLADLGASTISAVDENNSTHPSWLDDLPLVTYHNRTFIRATSELVAEEFPPGTWEFLTSVQAVQQDDYLVAIPTVADSSSSGVNHTVVVVTAHTTTPSVWYAGEPDSGYSVDNIAPGVPQGFIAVLAGSAVDLDWQESDATDFQYFRVYRGTTPGFTIGPASLVQSTASLAWSDPSPGTGIVYYKLTALDHAGNEGSPVTTSVNVTTGVDDTPVPVAFALHAAVPNPFHSVTAIDYDMPAGGGPMRLAIYDVRGRLVRTLVDGVQLPGKHSVSWDGRDNAGNLQPAGFYISDMRSAGFVRTLKLLFVR
jgi:hypothetical protein